MLTCLSRIWAGQGEGSDLPCDVATLTDLRSGEFSVCSPFVVWVGWWASEGLALRSRPPGSTGPGHSRENDGWGVGTVPFLWFSGVAPSCLGKRAKPPGAHREGRGGGLRADTVGRAQRRHLHPVPFAPAVRVTSSNGGLATSHPC